MLARTKILHKTLENFYENFNFKYDYPIYLHTFGKLTDNNYLINLRKKFSKNIFLKEIEYEIELALPKRCASAVRMDPNNSATLGHIGWLKPAASGPDDDTDLEAEEEEMLTDTRFRPVRRHTTVYQ